MSETVKFYLVLQFILHAAIFVGMAIHWFMEK